MGRTRTRGALVQIVATRLLLREQPPRALVSRLLVGFAAVLVIATTTQLVTAGHLALVVLIGLSSLGVLATGCLYLFNPALAVSVVGVALGCASLMTALSVATGFESAITREVTRLNGHVLLTKYGLDFFEYEELGDRLLDDPRVTAASPFAYAMVAVAPEGESEAVGERPVVVMGKGLDPQRAGALSGIAEVMGRGDLSGLRPGDVRHRPGLVLGDRVASRVGVAVGDEVRIVVPAEISMDPDAGRRAPRHGVFEVLDLLHTGTADIDGNVVLMHLTAAQALFFREGRVTGIELELTDADLADDVATWIDTELPRMYRTSTWEQTNQPTLVGLRQIKIALSLVLGLMMLVAASSLVSSMLLLIRRKRPQIATFLALGSEQALMFWVFEAVGLLAGAVGASVGLALGGLYCLVIHTYEYPLAGDVYPLDHLPVVVRAPEALGPAMAAVLLCGLASGPVALVATRVGIVRGLNR